MLIQLDDMFALQKDANGDGIQLSGKVNEPPILIRQTSDGVVVNGETLNDFNSELEDGKVDIAGCPIFFLWVAADLGTTPLTSVTIIPKFGTYGLGLNGYRPLKLTFSDGSADGDDGDRVDLVITGAAFTNDGKFIYPILNPGADFVQIYTASSGTDTASHLDMHITKGFVPQAVL